MLATTILSTVPEFHFLARTERIVALPTHGWPPGRDAPYPDRTTTLPKGAVMLDQIVQIAGSLLILTAFVAAQRGWLNPQSRRYLVLNLLGSAVLAVEAAFGGQWGFLLLETVWAVVSAVALVKDVIGGARRKRDKRERSRASL